MDGVVVPSTANPIRDRIRQELYRLLKAVGSGGKSLWLQLFVIVLFREAKLSLWLLLFL